MSPLEITDTVTGCSSCFITTQRCNYPIITITSVHQNIKLKLQILKILLIDFPIIKCFTFTVLELFQFWVDEV